MRQGFVTNKWEKIKKEHVKRCGSEEDVGYNKNRTCQILHKSSTELNSFDVALEGAMGCAACTVGCGGCAVVAIQQYLLTYLIDTSISLIEQLAEAAQELFVEELEIAIQVRVLATASEIALSRRDNSRDLLIAALMLGECKLAAVAGVLLCRTCVLCTVPSPCPRLISAQPHATGRSRRHLRRR